MRPDTKSCRLPSGVTCPARHRPRMSNAPFVAPPASGLRTTRIVAVSSTYACCSSFTVRPVTRTVHLVRSSESPAKSSKKTMDCAGAVCTGARQPAPRTSAATSGARRRLRAITVGRGRLVIRRTGSSEKLRGRTSATPLLERHGAAPQVGERGEALGNVSLGGLRSMAGDGTTRGFAVALLERDARGEELGRGGIHSLAIPTRHASDSVCREADEVEL